MQITTSDQATQSAIRTAITVAVAQGAAGQFGSSLKALILTGSLARNEATIVARDRGHALFGDAEFLAVFENMAALPSGQELAGFCSVASRSLEHAGIWVELSISAAPPEYLCGLGPEIFAYELRACGVPVWGAQDILSLIPAISPLDISREDAWRLLCNRMVEMVEAAADLSGCPRKFSVEFSYRVVKLCLDMATSFLVFEGGYAPTYRQRQENLSRMAKTGDEVAGLPFPILRFARLIEVCTEWKLNGTCPEMEWGFWQDAVESAHKLWRWETGVLAGVAGPGSESDEILMRKRISQQSLAQRFRGWLYVLRSCGWYRSWRHWPRWAMMAQSASPRYWTYAAASQLFFRLPTLVGGDAEENVYPDNRLPVPRNDSVLGTWRSYAGGIAWNYHAFLEKTRT